MRVLLLFVLVGQALSQFELYDTLRPSDYCVDRQADCEKWAKQMPSQCIYNAHYMRSSCQKSCEVVPVCKDSLFDPWKGLATAGGTSKHHRGLLVHEWCCALWLIYDDGGSIN